MKCLIIGNCDIFGIVSLKYTSMFLINSEVYAISEIGRVVVLFLTIFYIFSS